ncbi:MAG: trypsin-like peptidase domain-containing protein [Chitinophagaceae bacterium]
MFVNAIKQVAQFTSPIHTIERSYGSITVRPGAATMFFVNEEGVAVTCNHVAQLIPFSENLLKKYTEFKAKKNELQKSGSFNRKVKELLQEYGFENNPLCEILIRLNCAEGFAGIEVTPHPKYDLAIVKLIAPKNLTYTAYARFIKDETPLEQGMFLCRLGFPFPEFTNFKYNSSIDSLEWTDSGMSATPRFPIEGMITRHLSDGNSLYGIEMSTPGLKGQSGGPLFNSDGIVCGMQFATNHLHLGFDMKNKEVISNGEKIKITNQPCLHVGYCLHANVIKDFLREKQIRFYEEGQ